MARSCWRLLVVLPLIFVTQEYLHGQGPVEERVPFLRPNAGMLRYPSPIGPTRLPVPLHLPRQFPFSPDAIAFQKIAGAAGIIFSGRVTAIGQTSIALGQSPASTAVTFQVEQALRGISLGQVLTIHEWAGLWSAGEHYRVGERVLLFLYPPSKLGLTSPVAGAMCRFAMDPQGHILLNGQHMAMLGADPILGRRAVVTYSEFARAVQRVGRESEGRVRDQLPYPRTSHRRLLRSSYAWLRPRH